MALFYFRMREIKDLIQKFQMNYYKQAEHLYAVILNNTEKQLMLLIAMKWFRCVSLK